MEEQKHETLRRRTWGPWNLMKVTEDTRVGVLSDSPEQLAGQLPEITPGKSAGIAAQPRPKTPRHRWSPCARASYRNGNVLKVRVKLLKVGKGLDMKGDTRTYCKVMNTAAEKAQRQRKSEKQWRCPQPGTGRLLPGKAAAAVLYPCFLPRPDVFLSS